MNDHLVLSVDHLITPEILHSLQGGEVRGTSRGSAAPGSADESSCAIHLEGVGEHGGSDEEESPIKTSDLPRGKVGLVAGTPLHLNDPWILVITAAECHFLENEYDEYADSNGSDASFFHSAALIFMTLLLLRHAISITNSEDDDDAYTYFLLYLLWAVGFLLLRYIMAWAISILQ